MRGERMGTAAVDDTVMRSPLDRGAATACSPSTRHTAHPISLARMVLGKTCRCQQAFCASSVVMLPRAWRNVCFHDQLTCPQYVLPSLMWPPSPQECLYECLQTSRGCFPTSYGTPFSQGLL